MQTMCGAALVSRQARAASAEPVHPRGVPARTMQGMAWGFLTNYQFGYKGAPVDYARIGEFIDQLGHSPAIIHSFFPWKRTDGSYSPFPREFADYVRSKGAMPLITWPPGQADVNNQVEDFQHNRPQPDFDTVAIASGIHDAYIRAWADAAKAYGLPVYVRFMHEMLGTPYPHAYGQNRNTDPAQYVAAFRHVIDIFHRKNVTNVHFVWCFGCGPREPAFETFFPGDDYVEWVSLDGYNTLGWGQWKSFEEVFGGAYSGLERISRRPVMIGEIGCVEDPHDPSAKANWIKDAFLNVIPKKMPRVKVVVFFNSGGHEVRNYQVDSSPASFNAYQAVITSPLYRAVAPLEPLYYDSPTRSLPAASSSYKPGAAVDTPAGVAYRLSVNSGCSGSGSYRAGTAVHIAADKAPSGKLFDKWVINSGSPRIADIAADSTTLTMSAGNAVVTATYKNIE
jgi:beta-mannanase